MKDRFLQQTKREYGSNQRLAALAVEAVFFIGILPLALLLLGGLLDRWLGWPKLMLPPVNAIVGALLIATGWGLGIWSVYVQFTPTSGWSKKRRWWLASARSTRRIAGTCHSSSPGCAGVAEGCGFGPCRETGDSVRI
jgi:hypothetical protein